MKNENIGKIYDAVIIGAGIGGLICGALLAKNRFKILIVEQHYQPGGCCQSFKRDGFVFDAAAHIIGSCNNKGVLGRLLNALDIKINFTRISPMDRIIFPETIIEIPSELNEYVKILSKKFPRERNNIEAFFKEMLKISLRPIYPENINKYQTLNYQEMLDLFFNDNKLKAILSVQNVGLLPMQASCIFMFLMLASYMKDGVFYPQGGSQFFANSIAARFKELGGDLLLSTKVIRILLKDNKVDGVVLSNGMEVKAKVVISNVDAVETFLNLIGENNLKLEYISKLKEMGKSPSLFITYLGVKMPTEKLKNKRGWYYPSEDINRDLRKALYLFIPTLYDHNLAKENCHIVQIFRWFPYKYNDILDWNRCKDELLEDTILKLEMIIPEISKYTIVEECATPKTIWKYTSNSEGAAYGWAPTPSQVFRNRLSNITPIEGLYLVGHWTRPGGGIVSVAVSGWTTAKDILLKRKLN